MGQSSDEQTDYSTILEGQLAEGLAELRRPMDSLFLSALSAGLDIGFGPLLMAVTLTLAGTGGGLDEPIVTFMVANAYSVGFILVILGRSELFTEHTTLAVLPVLDGRASPARLARLWGIVYAGNIVGGVGFAAFAVLVAPALKAVEAGAFVKIASKLVAPDPWVLFAGAIFAGWLMGLLSWLVGAAQETISRVFFVWLVTTVIALAGLPHCIVGNVEVLLGLLAGGDISWLAYGRFMVFVTAGNAVGGAVFVALLKYGHVVRGSRSVDVPPSDTPDTGSSED